MKQIEEGPAGDKSRALAMIHDDEGFNWNKYIPDEGSTIVATTIPVTFNRERAIARLKMNKLEKSWLDAKRANRWDAEKECYLHPQGNILTDLSTIDFEAFVKTIPAEE
ncbi:hypothetical protein Hanom_Chr11g01013571 [Helianthus anomalus]